MPTIGQKGRPAVPRLLLRWIWFGQRDRRAAGARHAIERAASEARSHTVENRAVSVPRAGRRARGFADCLRRPAGHIDHHQLSGRDESEMTAVRRPEGTGGGRGPRQKPGFELGEWAHPEIERPARRRGRRKHDEPTIGRHHWHDCLAQRVGTLHRDRELKLLLVHRRMEVVPRRHQRGYQQQGHNAKRGPRDPLAITAMRDDRRGHASRRSAFRDPAELEQKIVGGVESVVGIFGQTRADDAVERRWRERPHLAHRRRRVLQDRAEQARLVLAGERLAARQHLEQHGAKREDVGARVRFLALDLLRRHVLKRPQDGALRRKRRSSGGDRRCCGAGKGSGRVDFRQSEVEELCLRGTGSRRDALHQHHVAGLQVAMHDPLTMRAIERTGDVNGDLESFGHSERPALEPRGQRLTLEVLHDEELGAALAADVVERADVRVVERGDASWARGSNRSRNCGSEARAAGRTFSATTRSRRVSLGFVDLAHPTCAERQDNFVGTEAATDRERHEPGGLGAQNSTSHSDQPA